MNILVTGATGFIGSHLAEHLSQDAENIVYGLYRSIKPESTFNALKLSEKKNINLILGSVNNPIDIQEIVSNYDIDQIFHLAAQPIVQKASMIPIPTYFTNTIGTLNILEAVRITSLQKNKEIPTYIMSTDKSYGTSNCLPYQEEFPLNGLDIYSASKACADIMARSYAFNYDLPIVVGRPSNAYGIDFHWTRLVPSLAKSCLLSEEKSNPLVLNKGSYQYIREYTYINDTVKAIVLLIDNISKTKGNAYNISSNYKYTTEEVVNKFLELSNSNKEIEFKEKESTFKEIPEQYLDTSKLKSAIDWKPEYNLEDGLKETINRYNEWFNLT